MSVFCDLVSFIKELKAYLRTNFKYSYISCQNFFIIVAFLENATIGYSLESVCVCVCVCVCLCVCVFLHDNSK